MRYTKYFFLPLLLVMALLLAACGSAQPAAQPAPTQAPEPAAAATEAPAPTEAAEPVAEPTEAEVQAEPEEKVELVFRQGDPPGEVEGLQKAVDNWNAEHPNIQVRMETVPWSDAQAQFVREVQAGGGPDVAQIAFVWTADLGRNELLTELSPFLADSTPGKGMDDFLGVDLGMVDDKIYGVPWTVDSIAMVYRPDLLEEAGVAEFPDTWEELHETAKILTKDTNGDGRTDQYGYCFPAGSGPDGSIWFLANAYLWSNGKTFIQEDGKGGWMVGVTPEDVADAMAYFQWFFDEKVTPESLIAVSWEGDPEMVGGIARGDCAITSLRLATFRQAAQEAEKPIMMAVLPQGSVKRVSHLGGRTLALNPNTEHPQEAWEFLKFLASGETFETYNQFPAQKALLAEIQPTLPESEQAYAEQLAFGITFRDYIFSKTKVSSMWETTAREFGAVFSGQKTIEQASADLVQGMETLLAEAQKN